MYSRSLGIVAALLGGFLPFATAGAAEAVAESAREIPVAYDVDVVVVGGTTGAVSAAVEAARQGAKVFLAAPRPYLGEDVCGTLRLWLEPDEKPTSDFEKSLFVMPRVQRSIDGSLKYSYKADKPSNRIHADTKPPSRLNDGKWSTAVRDSVQYDENVTLVADLGRSRRVKSVHLLVYQRNGDFEVADAHVWTSPNGTLWRDLGTIKNSKLTAGDYEDSAIWMSLDTKQNTRHVKLEVRKTEQAKRMLLAELAIVEDRPVPVPEDVATQPPTPMHVKVGLDKALLEAGVQFLYGCAVSDVLRDSQGNAAGIVMVNRAGRQAVEGKVVIDATGRATAARLAGAPFKPFPAGPHTFERIIVGGQPHKGPGTAVRKSDVKFFSRSGEQDVFVYTLTIPMKDASFASFAEAEQIARDRTFDPALVDESDVLYHVPADPIVSRGPAKGDDVDPATLDLAATQPKGLGRLYVLGGCIDVSRDAAAKLMRPLAQIRLGQRVGAAAAKKAKTVAPLTPVELAGNAGRASHDGDVLESLGGVRPTHTGRPNMASPERTLPIFGSYDVVVVGGGTGGAPAGIGAARHGAKTLVIEYQDGLGGVGTLGMISLYYHGYRHGFTTEVDQGVEAMNGPARGKGWNIACKKEWWRREIRKAGGEIWFSTLGCGALVEDGRVSGVIVTTPLGRGVVLAKTVVDATGNADIAAAAGARCITTSAEHIAMQGTGLPPRELGAGYTNTDYSFVDESDPVDQWRMLVTARRKYHDSYDLSPFIDTRERRRIVGEFFITPLDLITGRTYPDSIAIHQSNFDTHGYTVHPVFMIDFPNKKVMQVFLPYRCLLPKGLDGILVTGLGISAHRDAMPILRMQACIQNQGYAAGVAAAMSAREGKPTREIDIRKLQKHLVEIGCLTPDVLDAKDSYPLPAARIAEAVSSVVDEYQGLAVILANPNATLPLLRQAWQSASSEEHRLIYANILGMMGDPTGAETLIKTIDGQSWDEGWNFKAMGQFGGSISRLDSLIIALGRSGDKRALATILRKVAQLDASNHFSHHRAVALALEVLHDRAACEPLARLLAKPDMTGYAVTEVTAEPKPAAKEHRALPLREVILARALFRCGDHNGIGRNILETYEKDLRGLFARHAQAVLNEKK